MKINVFFLEDKVIVANIEGKKIFQPEIVEIKKIFSFDIKLHNGQEQLLNIMQAVQDIASEEASFALEHIISEVFLAGFNAGQRAGD